MLVSMYVGTVPLLKNYSLNIVFESVSNLTNAVYFLVNEGDLLKKEIILSKWHLPYKSTV